MAQEIADSKLLDTWGSGGTKIEPDISKIIEGWQLGEQPPHEYMNWLQNTFGSKLNHILKNGVAKWDGETEYLAGASVQHSGNVWICETTNTNSEPTGLNANWEKVAINKDLTVTVDTLADLRSISYPANTVWASGYHAKNDGAFGSHIFRLKGVKTTEVDNGGTIIIATISGVDYVYELQFDGAVNIKWFGAKADGTDISATIISALLYHDNVEVCDGEYICNFMIEINSNKSVKLGAKTTIRKTVASIDTNPIFWLRGQTSTLKGFSFSSSTVISDVKAPNGVIRIGHENMTVSHGNVNYCNFSDIRVDGSTQYGQTSGNPDICVNIVNPQIGGATSYFHNIHNIFMTNANYGLVLNGWANANIISHLQGYRLGNVASGHNAMLWLNGALDNSISGAFFHSSPNSKMLKLTNFDNTAVAGGNNHMLYTNTLYGLSAEQGGASAIGAWSDVTSGSSYIEIRHNTALGNSLPVGWSDNNKLVGLGGMSTFLSPYISIDKDGTNDVRFKILNDRYLFGKAIAASPDADATNQFGGTIKQDNSSTRSYNATGAITVTFKSTTALNGTSWNSAVVEILYTGIEGGGSKRNTAKYLVEIAGLSTWSILESFNIGGDTITITQVSSSSTELVFTVEGSATSKCAVYAVASTRLGAVLK